MVNNKNYYQEQGDLKEPKMDVSKPFHSASANDAQSKQRFSQEPAVEIHRVVVIGGGVMGCGVAQNLAQVGIRVSLIETSESARLGARKAIRRQLNGMRLLNPGALAKPVKEILSLIEVGADLDPVRHADYVIENIVESVAEKQALYNSLNHYLPQGCTIAANTSAIPIRRLAERLQHPETLVGIHFMNPVPEKNTVELIAAETTGPRALADTRVLLARMGKQAIAVKDVAGFVSNRILMLTINEAINTLEMGVSSADDIDALFCRCFGHAMGPLATADLIGLDVIRDTLIVLREEYDDDKYKPTELLQKMVEQGHLGRKSAKGFFQY